MKRKISITTKILSGFLLIIVLSSLFLIISYPLLSRVQRLSQSTVVLADSTRSVRGIEHGYNELNSLMETYLEVGSITSKKNLESKLKKLVEESRKLLEQTSNTKDEKVLFQELNNQFFTIQNEIEELFHIKEKRLSSYLANKKLLAVLNSEDKINNVLEKILSQNVLMLEEKVFLQRRGINKVLRYFLFIELGIILFGLAMAVFLSKFIVANLLKLVEATKRLAKGDLKYRVKVESRDEIGQLGDSFNRMAEDLSKSTTSIENLTEAQNKLKASNQQLAANEQQLKAANQQLRANEQQLRASNQQLKAASERMLEEINERKKAQAEKEKVENQLLHSQKLQSVGVMANGIAHNFNNILSIIRGYADMTLVTTPQGEETYSYAKNIIKGTDDAKGLIKKMLTFSRLEKPERKVVQINSVIEEAMKLFSVSMTTPIKIQKNIDVSCGAILADAKQIQQVVMNLCNNGYHAMLETGGVLEVSLNEAEVDADLAAKFANLSEGKYVRLRIKDSGHGMDKATLERIFEPFFTTKEIGKGTGLGLSSTYGIVMNHQGEIVVNSEIGKGTTFTVYFPLVDDDKKKKEA